MIDFTKSNLLAEERPFVMPAPEAYYLAQVMRDQGIEVTHHYWSRIKAEYAPLSASEARAMMAPFEERGIFSASCGIIVSRVPEEDMFAAALSLLTPPFDATYDLYRNSHSKLTFPRTSEDDEPPARPFPIIRSVPCEDGDEGVDASFIIDAEGELDLKLADGQDMSHFLDFDYPCPDEGHSVLEEVLRGVNRLQRMTGLGRDESHIFPMSWRPDPVRMWHLVEELVLGYAHEIAGWLKNAPGCPQAELYCELGSRAPEASYLVRNRRTGGVRLMKVSSLRILLARRPGAPLGFTLLRIEPDDLALTSRIISGAGTWGDLRRYLRREDFYKLIVADPDWMGKLEAVYYECLCDPRLNVPVSYGTIDIGGGDYDEYLTFDIPDENPLIKHLLIVGDVSVRLVTTSSDMPSTLSYEIGRGYHGPGDKEGVEYLGATALTPWMFTSAIYVSDAEMRSLLCERFPGAADVAFAAFDRYKAIRLATDILYHRVTDGEVWPPVPSCEKDQDSSIDYDRLAVGVRGWWRLQDWNDPFRDLRDLLSDERCKRMQSLLRLLVGEHELPCDVAQVNVHEVVSRHLAHKLYEVGINTVGDAAGISDDIFLSIGGIDRDDLDELRSGIDELVLAAERSALEESEDLVSSLADLIVGANPFGDVGDGSDGAASEGAEDGSTATIEDSNNNGSEES